MDILGCHNALENFYFLPASLLHSLVLNVAKLHILYDVIIVGDIVFHHLRFFAAFVYELKIQTF